MLVHRRTTHPYTYSLLFVPSHSHQRFHAFPPSLSPSHPHPAHRKDEGNEFYKQKNYRAAIDAYSLAIAEAPDEPSFYGNRAAAHMMILAYESAIEDCEKAIALSPGMVKAYFRKGKALATLGKEGGKERGREGAARLQQQRARPLTLINPSSFPSSLHPSL